MLRRPITPPVNLLSGRRPFFCSVGIGIVGVGVGLHFRGLPVAGHLQDLGIDVRVGFVREDVVVVLFVACVGTVVCINLPFLFDTLGSHRRDLGHSFFRSEMLLEIPPGLHQHQALLLQTFSLEVFVGFLEHCPGLVDLLDVGLELRTADPDLDMLGASQKPFVQRAGAFVVLLFDLEVDVGFPQHFGHIQHRLVDGQLEDTASTVDLRQGALQLREFAPGEAVLGHELKVLLVQLAATVYVAELQLKLDVPFEDLLARAPPDSYTEGFAG
mmetsp:Transcript_46950/g.92423  ORF Transcript_46950/g.92423 Transcript_46950/m.92423 type:complete len:271 (+) Transcript_46950:73-885(+)